MGSSLILAVYAQRETDPTSHERGGSFSFALPSLRRMAHTNVQFACCRFATYKVVVLFFNIGGCASRWGLLR